MFSADSNWRQPEHIDALLADHKHTPSIECARATYKLKSDAAGRCTWMMRQGSVNLQSAHMSRVCHLGQIFFFSSITRATIWPYPKLIQWSATVDCRNVAHYSKVRREFRIVRQSRDRAINRKGKWDVLGVKRKSHVIHQLNYIDYRWITRHIPLPLRMSIHNPSHPRNSVRSSACLGQSLNSRVVSSSVDDIYGGA